MNAQIGALVDELQAATSGFATLAESTPPEAWRRRPADASWSAAECLAHLNLTSEAYLPEIRAGLEEAKRLGAAAPARFRRDPLGWLLWRSMGPPVRLRMSTAAPFVPAAGQPAAEMLQQFEDFQAEIAGCLREAEGLPIHRVKIRSPFDRRVRYNLFAALSIVPRHQLRHLWQAERALAASGARGRRSGTKSASPPSPAEYPNQPAQEAEMADDRKNERGAHEAETGTGSGSERSHGSTREKLEPAEGPPAPQGDALLDGSGNRHGVDERDERPGERG